MDVVLRNAHLVDGTGSPARAADVGVENGRIVAVGEISIPDAGDAEIVDLDGLTLAPGFIDSHTHYDAQITWDPDLTPSCWHGVTTVVMGNCGFSVAPIRPDHHGKILRTLENVEGMALDALEAGVQWNFETFPQYLDAVEALPKRCNMGGFIGHTPVRLYVMGDASMEREFATDEEVAQQKAMVEEGLAAGALGFASAKTAVHFGEYGKPVPSRVASDAEIMELATALNGFRHGLFQFTWGSEFNLEELMQIAESIKPHPVTITALLDDFTLPMRGRTSRQVLDLIDESGLPIWPQVSCKPLSLQINLEDPFPLAQGMETFQQIIATPREERAAAYRDPAWRERAKAETAAMWMPRWARTTIQETKVHTGIKNGPTVAQLAAERGVDPLDLVIDLALEENLETRFLIYLYNYQRDNVAELLVDSHTIINLSDAGAHASQLCDANFATYLLENWVRKEGVFTLEHAVMKLTQQPAALYGLIDRGTVTVGNWADLVAFDPDTVGTSDFERVWDLPAGSDRLVAYSSGIEHMWVNGRQSRRDGAELPVHAGALMRGGQY